MANNGNLKPFSSTSEARELGRKGGIASAKARRAAKAYSDAAKAVLASKFKTSYAGKDLCEACKAFGFGETETAAVMLALSDFLRFMKNGDKESADRLLAATGVNVDSVEQGAGPFESPQIYVLPAAKPGEEIVIEENDNDGP